MYPAAGGDIELGLTVRVPPGAAPGTVLRATGADGRAVDFTVPNDAVAGQQYRVPFDHHQQQYSVSTPSALGGPSDNSELKLSGARSAQAL